MAAQPHCCYKALGLGLRNVITLKCIDGVMNAGLTVHDINIKKKKSGKFQNVPVKKSSGIFITFKRLTIIVQHENV